MPVVGARENASLKPLRAGFGRESAHVPFRQTKVFGEFIEINSFIPIIAFVSKVN
jgi:hypothetical protein